jgi:hypothetical protein
VKGKEAFEVFRQSTETNFNLFIRGFEGDDAVLREAFSKFGCIVSLRVFKDFASGGSISRY